MRKIALNYELFENKFSWNEEFEFSANFNLHNVIRNSFKNRLDIDVIVAHAPLNDKIFVYNSKHDMVGKCVCDIIEDIKKTTLGLGKEKEEDKPTQDFPLPLEKPKDEFEIFKEWFLFWKNKLGLQNWSIEFVSKHDEDSERYAAVEYILDQRFSWVIFNGSRKNKIENIQENALHEVLHLLLADCETEDIIEHGIINTIINILNDKTVFNEMHSKDKELPYSNIKTDAV